MDCARLNLSSFNRLASPSMIWICYKCSSKNFSHFPFHYSQLYLTVYVNGILQNGLESGNNKPFWKYVKSQKQESFGISALQSNGNVITDSLSKVDILNSQFKSVFTPLSGNTFPQLPGTQFSKIKPLHISENGVFMWKFWCIKVIWTRQASWKITAESSYGNHSRSTL